MKRILFLTPIAALSISCTTLDQSFRLGAATGALTGAAAIYAGQSTDGRSPKLLFRVVYINLINFIFDVVHVFFSISISAYYICAVTAFLLKSY
jgi:hypothetical protein